MSLHHTQQPMNRTRLSMSPSRDAVRCTSIASTIAREPSFQIGGHILWLDRCQDFPVLLQIAQETAYIRKLTWYYCGAETLRNEMLAKLFNDRIWFCAGRPNSEDDTQQPIYGSSRSASSTAARPVAVVHASCDMP